MIGWIDNESIAETILSYRQAFDEMVRLCPQVEMEAQESNNGAVLPKRYEPHYTSGRILLPAATRLHVYQADLMDFHHPKDVRPGQYVWESDFWRVAFSITFPFNRFHWEAGRSAWEDEETGTLHPAVPSKLEPRQDHIVLSFAVARYGLNDWYIKADEIAHLCDDVVVEAVRTDYSKALAVTNKAVAQWEEARLKQVAVIIPRKGA